MRYQDRNVEIQQLREQIALKKKVESTLKELRSRQDELEIKTAELDRIRQWEEADVERLENGSLASFFYNVVGKMDDKLAREREEAYAARVRYDAAARELADVKEEIQRREAQLRRLQGCEERYDQILKYKAAEMRSSGSSAGQEMLRLEREIARLSSRQKELREAIAAGEAALNCADTVLEKLDSAHGWAVWDVMGGGVLTDMAKYSRLDEAQRFTEQLQILLGRFKAELNDLSLAPNWYVTVDGFMRFADHFFDNLFTDWTVMDQIARSQQQVANIRTQTDGLLRELRRSLAAAQREQKALSEQMDALIVTA